MLQNNLLKLDLTKYIFDPSKYKTPTLHETWKWEGDETVLPYKMGKFNKNVKFI